MKNRELFKLLCGALIYGLIASCMGLEDADPSLLSAPEVKSFEVVDNGSLVFELSASVSQSVVSRIAECGFYYGKDQDMSDAERIECMMTDCSFFADLTLREYGETFYVCSFISCGIGSTEICSKVERIEIDELSDYIHFDLPELETDLSSGDVNVKSSFIVRQGVEITKGGVCYGFSEYPDIKCNIVVDSYLEDESIDCLISEIDDGTYVYIRPFICDGDVVTYGEQTSVLVGENVTTVYIKDCTAFDEIALYIYSTSDEHDELNGEWPGQTPLRYEMKKGVLFKVFQFIANNSGAAQKLVFNNNGGGNQLSDYTLSEQEKEIYLCVSEHGITKYEQDGSLYALEEALVLSDNSIVQLYASVVAVTRRGFMLSDDSANMLYVYAGPTWESTVDINDFVKVQGTISSYSGNREMIMSDVVTLGSYIPMPVETFTLTQENIRDFADAGNKPCKVSARGEFYIDGYYNNIRLGDDSVVISVNFSVHDLSEYDGKDVTITGYYLWTSISDTNKFVTIILTDIEADEE